MRNQIDVQLARARAAAATRLPGLRTAVAPQAEGLARTLAQVFRERHLDVRERAPEVPPITVHRAKEQGMSSRPILVMAGGTGGHVYPALAVARALQAQSREVVWLGTHKGLESRVVPAAGIPIEWVAVSGLRGKGLGTLLLAPFRLVWALWQSLAVMLKHRPAAVCGSLRLPGAPCGSGDRSPAAGRCQSARP